MSETKPILTPGWHTQHKPLPTSDEVYRKMVGGDKGKSKKATFEFYDHVLNRNYHYWISNKHGYAMSTEKKCPSKTKGYKYMGFSSDTGWPKKMNTSRRDHEIRPQ